jgi:hypothetical protein
MQGISSSAAAALNPCMVVKQSKAKQSIHELSFTIPCAD